MARAITAILRDLEQVDFNADYMARLYQLSDELEAAEDAAAAVEPLLAFIERHSDKDLGAPGPLIHFLETVPGYEAALVRSLDRAPTELTVWMLNRLINVADEPEHGDYLTLMRRIASGSSGVRDTARGFLRHQERLS